MDRKRRKEIVEKVYKRGCRNCRNNCRLNFINEYLYTLKHKNKKHVISYEGKNVRRKCRAKNKGRTAYT